jgi:uncharacterized coiled-coil DUF342 family protein
MDVEEIKKRANNATQIYNDCLAKVNEIRKKQDEMIEEFVKKIDIQKIDKLRKMIAGL